MIHLFKKNDSVSKNIFLLLHGTGGDEHQLIDVGKTIDINASLLSIRGNEKEGTNNRFFKRFNHNVYDEQNLRKRTQELYDFVLSAASKYQFSVAEIVVIGYSNGANITTNLIINYGNIFKGAILMHPGITFSGNNIPDLKNMPILITAGTNDPICPVDTTNEISGLYSNANANVDVLWLNYGHNISKSEIDYIKSWYLGLPS
jgi:phospholipase/carboxylesterase